MPRCSKMLLIISSLHKSATRSKFLMKASYLVFVFLCTCNITTGEPQNDIEKVEITVERTPYTLKFSVKDEKNYELRNVSCSTANLMELANDENVCENLLPCTNYRAALYIYDLNTKETFPKEVYNPTEFIEPTVTVSNIQTTSESILLTWITTDSTCVLNYTILVKSPGKDIEKNVNNKQHDFLVEGLEPCVEHSIEMRIYDINENLILTLNKKVVTDRAEPGAITNIDIDTEFERGHARVAWKEPTNKSCIDIYYFKWFKIDCKTTKSRALTSISDANSRSEKQNETPETAAEEVCEWEDNVADPNEVEYLIKDLDGCENYGFQIFINSKTNAKSEVQKFISADGMPSAVIINPPKVTFEEVTLHWSAPNQNRKCVKDYQIVVEGPIQFDKHLIFNNATDETSATFDNLVPCGSYVYTITSILLNGTKGNNASSKFEMAEAKPTAIRDLSIASEPHGFVISWSEPAYSNLCVRVYDLNVWTNGKNPVEAFSEIINDTSSRVTGLIACQSYTIEVTPITKLDQNGEVTQREADTAAVIAQPPENFQYTDRYSNGIELSTRSNDVDNKCDIIFARFSCKPTSSSSAVPKKKAERNVEGKVGGISFKALLMPLSPLTEYSCFASFFNMAGWTLEKQIVVSTLTYYADTPREIDLKSISPTTIIFSWQPPLYPNGNINVYKGHFQRVRPEYYIPPNCPPLYPEITEQVSVAKEMRFTTLHPYMRYSIQVAAENEYGLGEFTRPFTVVTNASVSEPIRDLKVVPQGPYESEEEYKANVLLSWGFPCKSNGPIEYFIVEFFGTRGENTHNFYRWVAPLFDDDGIVTYNETNLMPDFSYKVSVAVRNFDVENTSAEKLSGFIAPAGIPKRFNESTIILAQVDAFGSSDPTKSALVRFPAFILEADTGSIVYAAILVSQKGCNEKPKMFYGALNSNVEWPESLKWNEAYANDESSCIKLYQTTPERWKPKPKAESDHVQFIVGSEKCGGEVDRYCNGPLSPDTEYYLVIRLFTRSGYNDAAILEFRTDSLVQLRIILISVSCCLLFALVAGFAYIYMTKRMLLKRQSYHDIEDPFGDIIAKNFARYYSEISRPEKLAREFKELTMVAMDFSYSASELGRNKNRYVDIYPYDKNRVILDIDADGSDYINASFISGNRHKKEYIATQGPKPESTLDFWRMILQHNIRVIVMVTQFREGDKIKCHEYFPYKSNGINVTVKKKETFEMYDRREMSVTHERYGLKQKVVHFYFKQWPDYACPNDPANLITFVRKVKAEKIPSYSSIVVHCSAGVGRTGTFIGLDIIMQRIKNESKINVYGTVKKLRFQRMKMVQTLEQYTFLYKCAYELVKHKYQRTSTKSDKKKVSFQDDEEKTAAYANNVGTLARSAGRPNDLSSIEENELEQKDNFTITHLFRKKHDPPTTQVPSISISSPNDSDSNHRSPKSEVFRLDSLSPSESTM